MQLRDRDVLVGALVVLAAAATPLLAAVAMLGVVRIRRAVLVGTVDANQVVVSSRVTSARSRARPIKLVNAMGRL